MAYNNKGDISRNVGSTVMDLFLACTDTHEHYKSFARMASFLASQPVCGFADVEINLPRL